jgi:hypothetical protein
MPVVLARLALLRQQVAHGAGFHRGKVSRMRLGGNRQGPTNKCRKWCENVAIMTIEELEGLPGWQATAVDNHTGHAIAIVRADGIQYCLYDGNSMTTPYATPILHPEGGVVFSLDEIGQMFTSRRLSVLRGFLPD